MKKKQLKFKIYQHECVDCGWKIWRDYIVENPRCSNCESTSPPKITEDELIKEIILLDTAPREEYEQAKRITQEIVDGRSLEEIDGLGIDLSFTDSCLLSNMAFACGTLSVSLSGLAKKSRMIGGCLRSAVGIQGSAIYPLDDNPKDNYY
jgi:hypothetical protein